jgi:fructose-1,6-bisphosphatase II / sedoheptulose-1,7-bisphosphatase
MSLEKLINKFIDVTSIAAISCLKFVGKDNKILADKAATDSMRKEINKLNINGEVVIGEGELDKAPMLYIGEKLGTKNGLEVDIAVDPLEGTNFVAKNLPGALSVIAISEKNNLFKAPETYMNKIAANVSEKEVINLDFSIKKNIDNLCQYKNKSAELITVCLLDRPRHRKMIDELKEMKVNLKLISDGDVAGALLITNEKYKVDLFIGIGGGPEGVLAASALDSYNCFFQGRFIFDTEEDKSRAKKMGINDFNRKYELNEIIKGDSIFCATAITDSDLLSGIKFKKDQYYTETFVTHKKSNLKETIKRNYKI